MLRNGNTEVRLSSYRYTLALRKKRAKIASYAQIVSRFIEQSQQQFIAIILFRIH